MSHLDDDSRNESNAGIVDLEHEMRSATSAALVEQISLLIETPIALLPITLPRLRLATWELRRRLQSIEGGVAA